MACVAELNPCWPVKTSWTSLNRGILVAASSCSHIQGSDEGKLMKMHGIGEESLRATVSAGAVFLRVTPATASLTPPLFSSHTYFYGRGAEMSGSQCNCSHFHKETCFPLLVPEKQLHIFVKKCLITTWLLFTHASFPLKKIFMRKTS